MKRKVTGVARERARSGQFLLVLTLFVVLISSVLLIVAGTGEEKQVVLGGKTQSVDHTSEAERLLDGVGSVDIKGDLDRLDQDISGL